MPHVHAPAWAVNGAWQPNVGGPTTSSKAHAGGGGNDRPEADVLRTCQLLDASQFDELSQLSPAYAPRSPEASPSSRQPRGGAQHQHGEIGAQLEKIVRLQRARSEQELADCLMTA